MPFVPDQPSRSGSFQPDPGVRAPQPEQPSMLDAILKNPRTNPMLLTPWGMAGAGMDVINKGIEHAAYDAGGRVTDATGSPEAGFAANVGIQALPVIAGSALGSGAWAPKAAQYARDLVRSAIKPSSAVAPAKVEQAIGDILAKQIPTTNAGIAGARAKAGAIDPKVDALVAKSEAQVPRSETERHLIEEMGKTGKADVADAKLARMAEELEKYRAKRPESMPVQLVHEAKKANYAETGSRPYMANADAETALTDEIRMALARGQREATIHHVPETAPLLKEQSSLLNLSKVAGPTLLREGNKNPIGIGAATPSTERLIAFLLDRSAAAKGYAARALYGHANSPVPAAGGGTVGALLANALRLGRPKEE